MTTFRIMHDLEVWQKFFGSKPFISWRSPKAGLPEICWFYRPAMRLIKPILLRRDFQELFEDMNPGITPEGFHGFFRWNTGGYSNGGVGYDFLGNKKDRRDWISKTDLDGKDVGLDKVRACGGAVIHGRISGNKVYVNTLDYRQPAPTLAWMEAHPEFMFEAVTVKPDGSNGISPQNGAKGIRMFFVGDGKEANWCKLNLTVKDWGKPYPYITRV